MVEREGVEGSAHLRGCPGCGLVHSVPALAPAHVALCQRCGGCLARSAHASGGRANEAAGAAALAALLLYPLAIGLPVLRLERFGLARDSSVWQASVGLLAEGELWLGGVVFLCSVVLPLAKLVSVVALVWAPPVWAAPGRARLVHALEAVGRWGMLDVLLVAVLVAWLKLGDLVEVTAGPGAIAFASCVALSLLAGAWFDAHALWDEERP